MVASSGVTIKGLPDMTKVLLAALGLTLAGMGWLGWAYQAQRADLTAAIGARADAERDALLAHQAFAQAQSARLAAEAEANRFQAQAKEYDALRATLEGVDDAQPLPVWFRDYLRSLFAAGSGPH